MKKWRDIEPGDWLFTCKMEPVQFSSWDEKDPLVYYNTIEDFNKKTDEEKNRHD